ncbi:MAG: hypothetical protein VKJ87_01945, partial [Synechococcus sp.]|nr:hypothetical protein [Synechococcus sp.]
IDDRVVETSIGGFDRALVSADWHLDDFVEWASLQGSDDLSLTGNRAANRLDGNSGNNMLDGGDGADTLAGGDGDDVYVVDTVLDVVSELAGEFSGKDTIRASVSLTLSAHVERLELISAFARTGIGNDLDNELVGNFSANTLDGLSGSDTMIGQSGNDIYYVDDAADVVIELAGQGADQVIASISWVLSDYVEDLTLVPVAGATGSALNLDGMGNLLANQIIGTDGDNRLSDGGGGLDRLYGGLGDDTYVVSTSWTRVQEGLDNGYDTVEAYVSYVLGSNIEALQLMGVDDLDGTGNHLDNVLVGNFGSNALDGARGSDTMIGGLGDDIYYVDHVTDLVQEFSGGGDVDVVVSSISYVLPDHLERLTLAGSRSIDGTGNGLDNWIVGNTSANVINGGVGADTMEGWLGDDTYYVDDPGDVIIDQHGSSLVYSSINWELTSGLDDLSLIGSAQLGFGNERANTLIGNALDNVLDGGEGVDLLTGGAGADRFVFRSVGIGSRADRITDFNSSEGDQIVIPASLFGDDETLVVTTISSWVDLQGALRSTSDLIYDSSSGAIHVNANGSDYGTGSSGGLLARLDSKPADLLASDFEVLPADSSSSDLQSWFPV